MNSADWEDAREVEQRLMERIEELEADQTRRSRWHIDSVWDALASSNTAYGLAIGPWIILLFGWTAQWQVIGMFIAVNSLHWLYARRYPRMRDLDKRRIEEG